MMPDPFDKLLSRFGENIVWCAAIIVLCAVLWIGGAL